MEFCTNNSGHVDTRQIWLLWKPTGAVEFHPLEVGNTCFTSSDPHDDMRYDILKAILAFSLYNVNSQMI